MSYSHVVSGPPPVTLAPAPVNVTSITKDAGATVSWQHNGTGVTSYTITPYIAGAAQSATTIAAGSVTTLAGSNGGTFLQAPVASLTNSTAYTFTVKANTSGGSSPESVASGANTPLANLVFGDDFNGAAGSQIDPEWWVYDNRCGYLAQNEIEAYAATQCVLDGSGNLKLTAVHTNYTVPRYASDPLFPGNVTQPWKSGACQSNVRTYTPTAGNTMRFEVRESVMADEGTGFWPGFVWLEGSHFLTSWKTDPNQTGWNTTDQAEIDIAEWPSGQSGTTQYVDNTWTTSSPDSFAPAPGGGYDATVMHTYACEWKPGTSCVFSLDGVNQHSAASNIAASGAHFFLLIYLQMVAGGVSTTESCFVDYVRVFDHP